MLNISLKITILLLVHFISSTVLCQSTNGDKDWDKESLKYKPENGVSSIVTTSYKQIDKFGESQEELFDTRVISFNEYGMYSRISDACEGFDPGPYGGNLDDFFYYNSTYNYSYQPNSDCLSSIYWCKDKGENANGTSGGYFKYSNKDMYICSNGKITEVIHNTEGNGGIQSKIYKTKFTYDERGNKIKVDLCNKNGYNSLIIDCNKTWILKYNSNNKKIEENLYDDKGYLEKINTYKYDNKGNLIEYIYQDGKDATSPSTHREITTNTYDSRNNIIKSQVIRYVGNNVGVKYDYYNPGTNTFTWYKYEYYLNNNIKKVERYWHFDMQRTKDGRIIPAKESLQDITEYKSYDDYGNWLEKKVYKDCYLEKGCNHRYTRYTRTIQYFDTEKVKSKIIPTTVEPTNSLSVNSIANKEKEDYHTREYTEMIEKRKFGGPRVTRGNRKIIKDFKFESELNKATVYALIKVSPSGQGEFVGFDKGSTIRSLVYANTIKNYLKNIQLDKSDEESIITIQFLFN